MAEPRTCDVCGAEIKHLDGAGMFVSGCWKDRGDEWEMDQTGDEYDTCGTCSRKIEDFIHGLIK